MGKRKGILDDILAPFGRQLVNPDNRVTDMLQGTSQPVVQQVAQPVAKPVAQPVAQPTLMEQAATQQPQTGLAAWNPFRLLFGDPNDPNNQGYLMGGNK